MDLHKNLHNQTLFLRIKTITVFVFPKQKKIEREIKIPMYLKWLYNCKMNIIFQKLM